MQIKYLWHDGGTQAVHIVEDISLLLYVGMLDELHKVLFIDAYAKERELRNHT